MAPTTTDATTAYDAEPGDDNAAARSTTEDGALPQQFQDAQGFNAQSVSAEGRRNDYDEQEDDQPADEQEKEGSDQDDSRHSGDSERASDRNAPAKSSAFANYFQSAGR